MRQVVRLDEPPNNGMQCPTAMAGHVAQGTQVLQQREKDAGELEKHSSRAGLPMFSVPAAATERHRLPST